MVRRCTLVLVVFLALAASASEGAAKRWWSYVEYLAGDKLEGRMTGSPGERLAAQFVADHFKQDGLKPAGTAGYIQPVKFLSRTIVDQESSLTLVREGKRVPLTIGEDANLNAGIGPAPSVNAPLAFVGYGLSIPEKNYDDLAGQDLHGKIAVFINGGPSSIPGPLRAHAQSAEERWKALHRAGAVGTIAIYNPHHMDIPWERAKLIRHQAAMRLADPALDETPGDQLAMSFNPAHADKLFLGTSHTFESLVAIAERGEPLPRFPLAASIEARTKFEQREVTSQNIVGILPGTDPVLKNEYIALTAHVDHLGIGEPIKGDKIYHGAMDNAAGVATMIDIADTLHSSGAKTRRSLLFIIVTGEEKGLLGSKYFAAHPTVPLAQIVGDLNVDMFLPIYPLKYLTVHGLEESDLGPLLTTVAAKEGVETQTDPAPARNVFIRSDQYSFIKKGIPSIFFGFGYAKGSPEETAVKTWLTERYHSPADDLKQPVDLPSAAKFNKILLQLAQAVADRPERPQWNNDSFFRRYAAAK
jgi:hypothetical protein